MWKGLVLWLPVEPRRYLPEQLISPQSSCSQSSVTHCCLCASPVHCSRCLGWPHCSETWPFFCCPQCSWATCICLDLGHNRRDSCRNPLTLMSACQLRCCDSHPHPLKVPSALARPGIDFAAESQGAFPGPLLTGPECHSSSGWDSGFQRVWAVGADLI